MLKNVAPVVRKNVNLDDWVIWKCFDEKRTDVSPFPISSEDPIRLFKSYSITSGIKICIKIISFINNWIIN